ncbi:putative dinitrogenase reductase activating glycohydrolase [Prevotella sp. CAG:1031]|nr:putative dinitrogenase reductase activating glycohydrolase [Prevotella sp. CAG:1031]
MDIIKDWIYRHKLFFISIIAFVLIKVAWVVWGCWSIGSQLKEKNDILQRKNWLVDKFVVEPRQLLNEMPGGLGLQFQGEWALYSCSMFSKALSNISILYPETKQESINTIDSLIQIVRSPELRLYDKMRWGEDPLDSIAGDKSHISYLSHLAWMIGNYRKIGGGDNYNALHDSLCKAMNRRILESECMNLPTYPGEDIYIPDMLVAIVALTDYAQLNNGKYQNTVNRWIQRAKLEWIDSETGLLRSFLPLDGNTSVLSPIKGSYSTLNTYYLTQIDSEFAKEQYSHLKEAFLKDSWLTGFKEYPDGSGFLGMDVDAGPIIFGLSPSGTAFGIGCATYFNDTDLRNDLLKTAEIAGHTVLWNDKRHYLLANIALVGEAITLAMRTTYNKND